MNFLESTALAGFTRFSRRINPRRNTNAIGQASARAKRFAQNGAQT